MKNDSILKKRFHECKELPKIEFYTNRETKELNSKLFNETANICACFVSDKYKNKSTQIRKFFDFTIKHINLLSLSDDKKYQKEVLDRFSKIDSLVAYNIKRNNPPINWKFEKFILSALEEIKDVDDFKIFGVFFESFIGFYMLYNNK
ncbi:type III-A CRISPR-associated protein Csm2 [Malaciobacter sp. WC5094]